MENEISPSVLSPVFGRIPNTIINIGKMYTIITFVIISICFNVIRAPEMIFFSGQMCADTDAMSSIIRQYNISNGAIIKMDNKSLYKSSLSNDFLNSLRYPVCIVELHEPIYELDNEMGFTISNPILNKDIRIIFKIEYLIQSNNEITLAIAMPSCLVNSEIQSIIQDNTTINGKVDIKSRQRRIIDLLFVTFFNKNQKV